MCTTPCNWKLSVVGGFSKPSLSSPVAAAKIIQLDAFTS